MPARLKRRAPRRIVRYTQPDATYLLNPAIAFFTTLDFGWYRTIHRVELSPAEHEQRVCDAWESLRSELLPRYISAFPGNRPWAWHVFDSPEPWAIDGFWGENAPGNFLVPDVELTDSGELQAARSIRQQIAAQAEASQAAWHEQHDYPPPRQLFGLAANEEEYFLQKAWDDYRRQKYASIVDFLPITRGR